MVSAVVGGTLLVLESTSETFVLMKKLQEFYCFLTKIGNIKISGIGII